MINPQEITNFNRNQAELEEFALFTVIVAGKQAKQMAQKLEGFLTEVPTNLQGAKLYQKEYWDKKSPFERIAALVRHGVLEDALKRHKMGQYSRISKAFTELAYTRNLETITAAELEAIPGIGPKTARFFLMHSRPNQQIATLDVHILKFLRELGHNAPKQTPTGEKYLILEKAFLDYATQIGKSPAELDLEIWKSYAKG